MIEPHAVSAPAERTYIGTRGPSGALAVSVQRPEAQPPHSLRRLRHYEVHSTDGFECGYQGSGPADLALAILADYLDDIRLAVVLHQRFKRDVVARLPQHKDWRLESARVQDWIDRNVTDADREDARAYVARPLSRLGIRRVH